MLRDRGNTGGLITVCTWRRGAAALIRDAAVGLALATGLVHAAGAGPAPVVPAGAASSGLIAVCVNGDIWSDGGFEATDKDFLTNSNYPVVFSTHFPTGHPLGTPPNGTPLCNVGNSDCQDGTTGLTTPRNGNSWAWFGGVSTNAQDGVPEVAYAEQTITFPPAGSSVTLNFYLRIGEVTSPYTDTLEVQVDGTTVSGGTFTEPATAESSYTLRTFDLTAFADGTTHAIKFLYTQDPANPDDNKANFDVDDVTLDIVCAGASPTALAVDSIGDGILEPNETVVVAPTWKNTGGADLPLTGTSSNFAGPGSPTYTNPDTSADYGTIATGASAQCTDCYSVHIMAVSRPATHWDATVDELLSTGASKTWTLHVGDSFTDVAHDGYYPFIETILHNGVTGGCGGGKFCPDLDATRAEMAVFLLSAKHGPGWAPPACTGVFTDVECTPTKAFAVDWIEELYHEGITAGCDVGPKYCPDAPITRAQMAVFLLVAAGITPPACTGIFDDVACPSGYADWIEQLYNMGITAGCSASPKLYCPDPAVSVPPGSGLATRSQMAVFLAAAFHLVLYGP